MNYREIFGKVYYKGNYPPDHWALQPYELTDANVIALIYYQDCQYAVYVNPTDKRGYRCIIRFINNEDMESTINRDYTPRERVGLGLITQFIADVYCDIVPISQISVAGNNSHSFDQRTRITWLGKREEPSFLHSHVYGRGDPEYNYIDDVKLDGPVPGLNFDMMAKTVNEPGNNFKVKWGPGEMEKVVTRIKEKIKNRKFDYSNLGLVILI